MYIITTGHLLTKVKCLIAVLGGNKDVTHVKEVKFELQFGAYALPLYS